MEIYWSKQTTVSYPAFLQTCSQDTRNSNAGIVHVRRGAKVTCVMYSINYLYSKAMTFFFFFLQQVGVPCEVVH